MSKKTNAIRDANAVLKNAVDLFVAFYPQIRGTVVEEDGYQGLLRAFEENGTVPGTAPYRAFALEDLRQNTQLSGARLLLLSEAHAKHQPPLKRTKPAYERANPLVAFYWGIGLEQACRNYLANYKNMRCGGSHFSPLHQTQFERLTQAFFTAGEKGVSDGRAAHLVHKHFGHINMGNYERGELIAAHHEGSGFADHLRLDAPPLPTVKART